MKPNTRTDLQFSSRRETERPQRGGGSPNAVADDRISSWVPAGEIIIREREAGEDDR